MANKTTFAESLRRVLLLEKTLNDLSQLRDEAFVVFNFVPLDEMNEIFETSWGKLFSWNRKHEHEDVPNLFIQNYSEVKGIFYDVTSARINRQEFADALTKSCEAVEKCIENVRSQLSEEEQKLHELYNEFTQSTGDFKFIFESPLVKQLIMDKLLKS